MSAESTCWWSTTSDHRRWFVIQISRKVFQFQDGPLEGETESERAVVKYAQYHYRPQNQTTAETENLASLHSISVEFRFENLQHFIHMDRWKLDSLITNLIRDWLEFPISTCVAEIASLPASFGGLDIPSLKDTAEKLRLSQRYKLHRSQDEECQSLWKLSSESNVILDSIIVDSTTKQWPQEVWNRSKQQKIGTCELTFNSGQAHNSNQHWIRSDIHQQMDVESGETRRPSFQICEESSPATVTHCSESPQMGKNHRPQLSSMPTVPDQQARVI